MDNRLRESGTRWSALSACRAGCSPTWGTVLRWVLATSLSICWLLTSIGPSWGRPVRQADHVRLAGERPDGFHRGQDHCLLGTTHSCLVGIAREVSSYSRTLCRFWRGYKAHFLAGQDYNLQHITKDRRTPWGLPVVSREWSMGGKSMSTHESVYAEAGWCITTGSAYVLQSRCAICCRICMRGVAHRLDWWAVKQNWLYSEEDPCHHTTGCQLWACPIVRAGLEALHTHVEENSPQLLSGSPGTQPQTTSLAAGASTGDLWTPTRPQNTQRQAWSLTGPRML